MSEELENMSEQDAVDFVPEGQQPEAGEESLDAALTEIYEKHESGDNGDNGDMPALPDKGAPEDAPKAEPEQKIPAVPYPASWSKDAQELFASLPPGVQEEIAKREQERERVVQQSFAAQHMARAMVPIAQGVKDLEPYFRNFRKPDGQPLWGDTAAIAKEIKEVLETKQLLFSDPKAGMQAIFAWARAAGLNLTPSGDDGQWQNPDVDALRQRLAHLETRDRERAQEEQRQRAEVERQSAVRQIGGLLESLGDAKDAQGESCFPHLMGDHGEQVGEAMGRWIRANVGPEGLTPELFRQAYETAVFSVAPVRDMEFQRREAARVDAFKRRSQAARKAAGIAPRPVQNQESREALSLEDQFNAIWAKYNA